MDSSTLYFFAVDDCRGVCSENSIVPSFISDSIVLFESVPSFTDSLVFPAGVNGCVYELDLSRVCDFSLDVVCHDTGDGMIDFLFDLRNNAVAKRWKYAEVPYPDDVIAFALSLLEEDMWDRLHVLRACREETTLCLTYSFSNDFWRSIEPVIMIKSVSPFNTPDILTENRYRKFFWRTIPQKVADISDQLSKDNGMEILDCLKLFYSSDTYRRLTVESTKLWRLGWRQLYDLFEKEAAVVV